MEQNKDQIALTACPSCGSQHFDHYLKTKDYFFTKKDFKLSRCNECTLVFTNPIPSVDKLSSFYESEKYLSHNATKISLIDIVYRIARQINIRRKYKLINKYKKPSKVLDIGTGTGELLHYFKENGWETIGIEPNNSARKFASEKNGLSVFTEEKLEELEEKSFDLIMMWHVLEHVVKLNERIEQIKRLLKSDGVIIIGVPNINSPDFHYYQKYWAGLDAPRHLYHFSETSIRNLFKRHSIRIIQSWPMKLDAYYVSLLSEKYRGNKFAYFNAFLRGFKSNIKARKQNNNYSSMIFVAKEN